MKTAQERIEIPLPEIPELALVTEREQRRWRARLRLALETAGWLLRQPRLERAVAPGVPALPEHEWRTRRQEWIA